MINSKDFTHVKSIFIDLVLEDLNSSSVFKNPGPSHKAFPESATNPTFSFGLKVVDLWVPGKFEVEYARRSKPIVMLNPRLTIIGGFKLNLNDHQDLLSDAFSRGLQFLN